nr:IPT/TIG domain-containing protein [Dyella sp. ASV24]
MNVAAQTSVSGPIKSDTHWTLADSPYVLSGDVVVQGGASLTIDAGTQIFMTTAASLTVQAGTVRALGSFAQPIKVSSDKVRQGVSAAPGDFRAWTFGPGTTATTLLEHVQFEYGSGLAVQGSAPVFNYMDVRNNAGAAISVDLAASPSGVGNKASGNAVNGVLVPAGDITGSVTWGLRGIPYVVQSGAVSVGRSPSVSKIAPISIERGQSINMTVDGVRLDGLASASFDNTGLAVTPFTGGTSERLSLQVKADAAAKLGKATLRLQLDAGELEVPAALNVTQPLPAITAIAPTTVLAGTGPTELVVSGNNFTTGAEVLVNSAALPTQLVNSGELRSHLPVQTGAASLPVQVRIPEPGSTGQYLLSNTSNLSIEMPVPPKLSFEPTPIAMPPDQKPHDITLRLSKADFRDHLLELSVSDATKATVKPNSLVIAAGQTSATVSIVPLAQGSATLLAQSATLGSNSVPMFITPDFRGLNTSYALPVGVVVQGAAPTTEAKMFVQRDVKVGVGGVLDSLVPGAWTLGATQVFEVRGTAIPKGSKFTIVPADGLSFGAQEVSDDGTVLRASVTAASDAATGVRRVVVRDDMDALLTFADASRATVLLAAGLPRVDSVSPIQVTRGTSTSLIVRGRNLQAGKVTLEPGDGIEVDAQPVINADGTELLASLRVNNNATTGIKVVRVSTTAGASESAAVAGNSLSVIDAVPTAYSTTARIVGVVVGRSTPVPDPRPVAPVLTSQLGVVVGASATNVAPRRGIIGENTSVTVKGQGLDAVTSVTMVPSTGLTIGSPRINADGTELGFDLTTDAKAALGVRRLVLNTTSGPIAFADVKDGVFLISAPVPEVQSATPSVLTLGGATQNLVLRGRNLGNASDVRFEPAQGITVMRPLTSSDDGSSLAFAVAVDASAAIGPRLVVVTTAAGESSSTITPANTVTLARQVGATYPAIASRIVNVSVGADVVQPSFDGTLVAPAVTVLIPEEAPAPITGSNQAVTAAVRVLVGSMANTMATDGWLQGTSGTLKVSGTALSPVTQVSATPATGLLFGTPSVNADGSELSVPISVAQDAPLTTRQLHLRTSDSEIAWALPLSATFGIGHVPSLDSVTPIVLTAGETTTLTIRGRDLASVTGATLLPGDGVSLVGKPAWSQDSLGEALKVTLKLDRTATSGKRVLQLLVPGGATSAEPSVVNTITVVPGS